MWQTTTPDGRMLILRLLDGNWVATCLANRGDGATAEEAIRGAVGAPIDGRVDALEKWIAEHVAELDSVES